MKKFFNSFKFILKAFFLVIILLLGWAFINITNLIKGKKLSEKDTLSKSMFGADEASADVTEGGIGGVQCCPFAAYFNGKEFQIENDFLVSSGSVPSGHLPQGDKLSRYWRWFFRSKISKPDLLKFHHAPKKRDGKLAFQLQENEAEESFISNLKFIRVAHLKNSEVIVDSGFEKFYVIEQASLKNLVPAKEVLVNGVKDASGLFNNRKRFSVLGGENRFESDNLILNKNDRLDFVFSGLKRGAEPVLIVKSTFRDFMMGEVLEMKKISPFTSVFYSPAVLRLGLFFVVAFYFIFGRKAFGNWPAFLPIFFGIQTHSIIFSYQDKTGIYKQTTINKPRVWNFSSEAIVLPEEAIMEDGTMRVKAEFTRRHKLAFAGVLQNKISLPYREEKLCVKSAKSSRLGDVTELLLEKNNKSLHLIPGDTVDIELEDPKISLNKGEKDTYLMQSLGVFTPLSSKYKKLAGNWMAKIPAEVRDYYARMANK